MKLIKFKADKISGLEGCLYALSLITNAITDYNVMARWPYPFYSLSFDLKKNKVTEWIRDLPYEKETQKIIDSLKEHNGLAYFEKIKKQAFKISNEFKRYVDSFVFNLEKLDDFDLVEKYRQFAHSYISAFGLSVVTFMYEMIVSEKLSKLIAARFDNAGEVMSKILPTDYKSFVLQSDIRLVAIRNEQNKSQKESLIQEYIRDYYFIGANYLEALAITKEHVLAMAKEAEPSANSYRTESKRKNDNIELTDQEQKLTKLLQLSEVIRDQRKFVNLIGNYTMFRFLDEVEKRTGLERELIKRMWWFEFGEFFNKNSNIEKRLQRRDSATIVFERNNLYHLDYFAIESTKTRIQKSLKGLTASKGQARGRVKIVFGPSQFHKMEKGDVLVSENTRPDFLPIMKKSAAIITEEGGITSHAAIVSRELGIPCIVGVKIVTELLKDGDLVEVDANKGVVKILKRK